MSLSKLGATIVGVALLAPCVAGAQQSFVAVGHDVRESESFSLQLGRELRGEKRRIGLRFSVEYARQGAQRRGMRFLPTDSGVFGRNTTYTLRSRAAGLWLSASYAPIRWYVAPYILVSAGVQDRLGHYETPALDSMTADGVAWPNMAALSAAESSFGPALRSRVGVAVRIRKVRLFGEVSPLYFRGPNDDGEFRDRSVTFGVRF